MWFKRKKPAAQIKKKSFAYVEVLQNGEFLATARRDMGKRGLLSLTSSPDGALSIPHYPLTHTGDLIVIDSKGAHVTVEPTWEGFITCDGKLVDLNSGGHNTRSFTMHNGDYGSIFWQDLRVLIRIGPQREPATKVVQRDPAYAGRLFPLWIGTKEEFAFLGLGSIGAIAIFLGFILGLLNHGDHRPEKFVDLPSQYILPFVNSEHLRTLPEALQGNLNRLKPLSSAIAYYNSFTNMILGFELKTNRFTMPNSVALYEKMYRTVGQKVRLKLERQAEEDRGIIGKQGVAIVSIPVVVGESFQGSILRLQDKIELLHQSLEANLSYRRKVVEEFRNDASYDFNEYRRVKGSDKTKEAMAKIKVWNILTDEQAMYKSAEDLRNSALSQQQRILQHRAPFETLSAANSAPIAIKDVNEFVSFSRNVKMIREIKVNQINASRFGGQLKERIREPLIGEIDPSTIEKTIFKNRFELQLCFELALRRNQFLGGTMEWRWLLDSRGSISDLELLSSSINDKAMIQCIHKRITGWKFPRPRRGSVEIRYPFNFTQTKG